MILPFIYTIISANLKLEMFENLFHTLKPVSDYNESSLEVIIRIVLTI